MQLQHLKLAAGLLSIVALANVAGCGKDDSISALGGGAHSPVAVTIIPKAAAGGGGGDTAAAASAGNGHVRGRISFEGATPALPQLVSDSQVKPDDKSVCIVDRIPNERIVVTGGGVKNVFVYIAKMPKSYKAPAAPAEDFKMDNNGCTFVPHAGVVRAGQVIRITNTDAVTHNVQTNPVRNSSFNSGVPPKDAVGITMTYKLSENLPVKLACSYHTWMTAWQLPLDHPFGAVTNENGEFEIRDIPAGKYEFTIFHEGNVIAKKPVTIDVDQTAPLDLALTAADFKLAANGPQPKAVILSMNH